MEIEKILLEIEAFTSCNSDGSHGFRIAKYNNRKLFQYAMANLTFETDSEKRGSLVETFLFVDEILSALEALPMEEIEALQKLIIKNQFNTST